MKHRKSLLLSIWGIALGIILLISGPIVAGVGRIYHPSGFATIGWYEATWVYYLGVGMVWSGIIILILGAFGVVTTFIKEYLDREHKAVQPAPSPTATILARATFG